MTGLNARAWARAERAIAEAAALRLQVTRLANGTRVIDAGIAAPGGVGAGLLLAELSMGGLGHVQASTVTIAGESWPGVLVWTDHPAHACMASQYAGWVVDPPGYFAMGSGPLRARARVERDLFHRLAYEEDDDSGVLLLETRTPPTVDVADWIAQRAGIAPTGILLAVAPTASQAGGLQVVARVVETGLHKMHALAFDVRRVVSAMGTAPAAPVARTDLRAIGRTNDCVLYGGQVRYLVDADDAELERLTAQLPASASPAYGMPFREIFERAGRDFYKIDPMLFSPAEVWLTSTRSGRTHHAGRVDAEVLRASLFDA